MQYALPHPSRSIAIPLATLVLGAAGGATVAAIVADDDVVRLPSANTPAEVQTQSSLRDRPQEGVASQAMKSHPQAAGLSERSTDRSVQSTVNPFVERPQEGTAVRSIGSSGGPGLSEKSTDPSVQSSNSSNSLGPRP